MRINMRTILTNIIESTIKEWLSKVPDKHLEEYENWQTDLVDKIDYKLSKQGISLNEVIIDTDNDNKDNKDNKDKKDSEKTKKEKDEEGGKI